MKKIILGIVVCLLSSVLLACIGEPTTSDITTSSETSSTQETHVSTTEIPSTEPGFTYQPIEVSEAVLSEAEKSFLFLYEAANTNPESVGYGLITDRINVDSLVKGPASIASVGFGLAALPIGVENGWITYEAGLERALGTLDTLEELQRTHGFYYHFVNMANGYRYSSSEVSIIDTALMIAGAIVAGEYFGGDVKTKMLTLYETIEWDWYFDEIRTMFYMGYSPENGFGGHWDMYAEQLLLYVLSAASENYSVGKPAYLMMKTASTKKSFGSSELFYTSYPGTLFTYQFSHAFLDFRNWRDEEGVDWFDNSVQASIAAYDYAQYMADRYQTLGENAWGMTASDGPDGYRAYGNLPAVGSIAIDGTLAPCGAIGSIVFTPDLSLDAIEYYASIPRLQSRYGFRDSFHLGIQEDAPTGTIRPAASIPVDGWFATDVIGIDKGITVLMIENYRSELVWHYFMQSELIQTGLEALGFTTLP